MRTKKSAAANLETRRSIFRQMGLLLALGFIFIAFEYTNSNVAYTSSFDSTTEVIVEADQIPVTRSKPPQLPPPPIFVYEILVVDDAIEIPEEQEIMADIEDIADIPILANADENEIDDDRIFVSTDKMPEFPGGTSALMKYLRRNVKYPAIAQENGIQGRVYIQFVVNKDGQIVDIKVIKSVDRSLDSEAVRVVENMPKWSPGEQFGKNVRVAYTLPINFRLQQ